MQAASVGDYNGDYNENLGLDSRSAQDAEI